MSALAAEVKQQTPDVNPFERHYTAAEIAKAWGMGVDTVRKVFRNEPGVLVFTSEKKKYRKSYAVLRIPESVLERVTRRMRNK